MEITLTRRGDYTVRAMLNLARHHNNGLRKARQIAMEMDIPLAYLQQVLAALVRQDLLVSLAGPSGGYTLARPPEELSLLDVIEAAEGPIEARQCALRGGPCDWDQACPLHQSWATGQALLAAHLGETSFADLAAVDRQIEAGIKPPASPARHAIPQPRRGVRSNG